MATDQKTEFVYKRPWLYPKQAEFVDCLARYVIVEATTKAGKTVALLVKQAEDCMFRGGLGYNYWWVAPVATQAKIAFTRMKHWISESTLPRDAFTFREQEQSIVWPNGTKQWFKSGEKPDNLYGEDVHGAVIDEATRLREESWYAVRSTLTATKGQVHIIGNVRGKKNWAYKMARRAESGEQNMAYFKLTAWDAVEAGVLDQAEIKDAQRALPKHVFDELYLAIPSDDGGNPFGLDNIAACSRTTGLASGPASWYGIDLAKKKDWVAVVGLNMLGQVCELYRWHGNWGQTKEKILNVVGTTPTLVDCTGVGDPVVEELHEKRGNVEGYNFSLQSKQHLMEALESAIHQAEIEYPDKEDHTLGWLQKELEDFEYEYTRLGVRYSAPEGLHDDGVCALALAQWCRLQDPGPVRIKAGKPNRESDELTRRHNREYTAEDFDRIDMRVAA